MIEQYPFNEQLQEIYQVVLSFQVVQFMEQYGFDLADRQVTQHSGRHYDSWFQESD